MTFAPKTATTLVLASTLALAACGGGAEVSDEPAGEVAEAAATSAPNEAAVTPAADESPTPAATPSEAPSATPSAAPSASPTPVAAAGPPPAFAVCAACHSVEQGKHGLLGPSLAGLFGNRAGTQAGFEYSEAMKNSGLTWNQATLDRYLENPRGVVPGTTMAYNGLKDAAQRQAMIAYLRGL